LVYDVYTLSFAVDSGTSREPVSCPRVRWLMRRLQLRLDFYSTAVRWAFWLVVKGHWVRGWRRSI